MCLATIEKTYEKPLPTERWAWKVFDEHEGRLYFPCYDKTNSVALDKWLNAKRSTQITGDCKKRYQTGFHCFTSKAEALPWAYRDDVIVRVRVRKVRIVGTQESNSWREAPCIVADEMMVPKRSPWHRKGA